MGSASGLHHHQVVCEGGRRELEERDIVVTTVAMAQSTEDKWSWTAGLAIGIFFEAF